MATTKNTCEGHHRDNLTKGKCYHEHSHRYEEAGHENCVAMVPIFNHLEDEQMKEIAEVIQHFDYKKGESIYLAGEQSNSLYIVRKGKIRIYRLSDSGKEQLVRILRSGDFTGELALFNEGIHESFAEAMEETNVCTIRRNDLQKLLGMYPAIALKILAEFSSRLEQSEKQTARFATEKVETRLALFLAECLDANLDSNEFVLPMSKKDIASYLGTTPETISRKLLDLEEMGYIRQKAKKRIEILDLEGLHLI